MPQHIGIVACSPEGAALCYRTICYEAHRKLGEYVNPEISINSISLKTYVDLFEAQKWDDVAELMLASAKKLASIGADFVLCPDNAVHEAFDLVAPNSPVPWLSLLEEVGIEAKRRGHEKVGILGTEYIMSSPLYHKKLNDAGLEIEIPNEKNRKMISKIVYDELANGLFTERSRMHFDEVVKKFKDNDADGVVLASSEISLLIDKEECPLPTLDSTRILARVAFKRSIEG